MIIPTTNATLTLYTLLNSVTVNSTSDIAAVLGERRIFQSRITGSGAVAATISWYGNTTNATTGGVLLVTDTLSGANTDQTGSDIPAEWPYVYCVLSGISGTNAAVTSTVSV